MSALILLSTPTLLAFPVVAIVYALGLATEAQGTVTQHKQIGGSKWQSIHLHRGASGHMAESIR